MNDVIAAHARVGRGSFRFQDSVFAEKAVPSFPSFTKLFSRRIVFFAGVERENVYRQRAYPQNVCQAELKKIAARSARSRAGRKLTQNYQMGCKRILVADDYWPAFNRANVYLETAGIAEIMATGIRTIEVNVIVMATGFKVADATSIDMKIIGRNGRELFAEWQRASMQGYKRGIVSGFPNFAYLLGPNAGLGHNSVLLIIEMQMNYVIDYLALLEKQG